MHDRFMHHRSIQRPINDICTQLSPHIPYIHSITERLIQYTALLLEYGSRLNLIGTVNIDAVCNQFIDVLSGYSAVCRVINDINNLTTAPPNPPISEPYHTAPHLVHQPINIAKPTNATDGNINAPRHHRPLNIADIGSGNGLPGIPFAMVFPNHRFVLVETKLRRINFLAKCVDNLDLTNVTIAHSAYQELPTTYDIVLVRALTHFTSKVCRKLKKLLHHPGGLIAYKGNDEQFAAEYTALSRCFEQVVAYSVLPANSNGSRTHGTNGSCDCEDGTHGDNGGCSCGNGKQGRIIIAATIGNTTQLETIPSAWYH